MQLEEGGYEPTTVPIPVTPLHIKSSYLYDNFSITNMQLDQFSCSDQRTLFSCVQM